MKSLKDTLTQRRTMTVTEKEAIVEQIHADAKPEKIPVRVNANVLVWARRSASVTIDAAGKLPVKYSRTRLPRCCQSQWRTDASGY